MASSPTPVAYCRNAKQFGRPGEQPTWLPAPGGDWRSLRAAVFQHHAGARLRQALAARAVSQRAYAQAAGVERSRLTEVLNGVRRMQVYDLANAAVLGADALPEPEEVHREVLRVKEELQPSVDDERSRTPLRRPRAKQQPLEADSTISNRKVQERALRAALKTFLDLADGERLKLHARPVSTYTPGGMLVAGSGKTHALVSLLDDWQAQAAAGRAGRLSNDFFIIATTETDAAGRPIKAIGLPKFVDDEEPRTDIEATIRWTREGPQAHW